MTLRPPLVLLGAYVLLTTAAYWGGGLYLRPWLPWLELESGWLLPDAAVTDGISLKTDKDERLIALRVAGTTTMARAGHTAPVRVVIETTTLQAYALHHAVIVLAILAACPVTTWRRRLAVLALGVPCIFLTTSLDIPFVLAGLAHEALLQSAPDRLAGDPVVLYYKFMHGGGRLGLAIVGALVVVVAMAGVKRLPAARQSA